jgi:putative Mg2+ transporter-C (MgtC) family protein
MRCAFGVLTGIGFIGAGAILRRGDAVRGVTTAATMWLVTVIGLVIGGGYFTLGAALVVLAIFVLSVLIYLERALPRDRVALLTVETEKETVVDDELRQSILNAGYRITLFSLDVREARQLRWMLKWRSSEGPEDTPPLVRELQRRSGVTAVAWIPQDPDEHE